MEENYVMPPPFTRHPFVHVAHRAGSGTVSGGFTSGAWRTRPLLVEVTDTDNLASLAANQITLEAGTWIAECMGQVFDCGNVNHQLYDTTGAATLLEGSGGYLYTAAPDEQGHFHVRGQFVIGVQSVIELQAQCSLTKASSGFGKASGLGNWEYYADVLLWRVAT